MLFWNVPYIIYAANNNKRTNKSRKRLVAKTSYVQFKPSPTFLFRLGLTLKVQDSNKIHSLYFHTVNKSGFSMSPCVFLTMG